MEKWNGADLEFAALDKLEGEDCSSLLSQGMTHGRHAAWSNASHILQTDNPFQDDTHMNHCLHCCVTCCRGFAAQNDGKEEMNFIRNGPERPCMNYIENWKQCNEPLRNGQGLPQDSTRSKNRNRPVSQTR